MPANPPNPTHQSPLDQEPTFLIIDSMIKQGATNSSIVKELFRLDIGTSEAAVRRFRKRHKLMPPSREKAGVRYEGDEADLTGVTKLGVDLDDPDTMLRERGLDPSAWLIESATINEWDGPSQEGPVTYHQAKLHLKRKRPELQLIAARSDGWKAPVRTEGPNLGSRLIIVLGDQQAPFHDENLHALTCSWLEDNAPDQGILLGDLVDYPDISRHRLDPENTANVNECTQSAYNILRDYRVCAPDTEFDLMPGNHCERLRNVILDKPSVQPLYGVKRADTDEEDGPPVLTLSHLLRLDELGINYVDPQGAYDLAQINLSHRLAVRHGWIARQGSGASALATLEHLGYSCIVGHCFDEETEILTPQGWKRHEDLEPGTVVMTLNRDSGELEWQANEQVHRYYDYDELIHIRNRNVDLAITPEHGLWVGSSTTQEGRLGGNDWREETAKEAFGKRRNMLLAGMHNETNIPLEDCWIKLLAWVMAEGHIDNKGGTRPYASVRIAQSDAPDGRLERLKQVIAECGIPNQMVQRYAAGTTEHGTHRNYDAYRLALHEPRIWRETFAAYLSPDKTPTVLLSAMSASQIETFLAEYICADGSIHTEETCNSYQIAAKRKDHIDWLQGLAVRAGYRSSISGDGDPVYYLTLNPRVSTMIYPDKWSRESYEGTVWCVTVPNGTLLVRRKGKTAITLNTHRQSIVYKTTHDIDGETTTLTAAEAGCMCRVNQTPIKGRKWPNFTPLPDWVQGFSTVTVHPDQTFRIDNATYVTHKGKGTLLWRGEQYR